MPANINIWKIKSAHTVLMGECVENVKRLPNNLMPFPISQPCVLRVLRFGTFLLNCYFRLLFAGGWLALGLTINSIILKKEERVTKMIRYLRWISRQALRCVINVYVACRQSALRGFWIRLQKPSARPWQNSSVKLPSLWILALKSRILNKTYAETLKHAL